MFYQIFLSPRVKRWAIITYRHGIYEVPHESPNDLRLKDLRKLGNIRKVSNPHRMLPQRRAPRNQSQPQIPREPPQTTDP